jgi:BolA family transcriptional regulator, general stress-responsive regulator
MIYNNKIIFMSINELIAIVKNKLEVKIIVEDIKIEDKSFLHKNHKSHQEGKFHLKLTIQSSELAKYNKIEATKKIYSILDKELKDQIHSIELLIN